MVMRAGSAWHDACTGDRYGSFMDKKCWGISTQSDNKRTFSLQGAEEPAPWQKRDVLADSRMPWGLLQGHDHRIDQPGNHQQGDKGAVDVLPTIVLALDRIHGMVEP